jgi:hypothetical protein
LATQDTVQTPSDDHRVWLRQAEDHVLGLLRRHLGDVSLNRREADLNLVQRALDGGFVGRGDELELQCLGVVLGNVFDATTEMKWAEVTNEYGRLLALHAPRIGVTLYPVQMIGNRVEDGRSVDVPALYRSLVHDLALSPA